MFVRFREVLQPGSYFDQDYEYNVDSLIQMTDGLVGRTVEKASLYILYNCQMCAFV